MYLYYLFLYVDYLSLYISVLYLINNDFGQFYIIT